MTSWDSSTLSQNSCKTRCPQKNICGGSIHIAIQTSKHLNKIKIQFAVICDSTVEVSLHSQSGWYFEIVFWMIWVLRTGLYLTFEENCENLKSKVMWHKICMRYASILVYPLCGLINYDKRVIKSHYSRKSCSFLLNRRGDLVFQNQPPRRVL